MAGDKWEYRVINDQADGNPEPRLSELGKQGWELCAILTDRYGVSRWYFKRKV